jgi:hypothetical protein
MHFRWAALIALWTLLSGPVFGPPNRSGSRPGDRVSAAGKSAVPVPARR